MSKHTTSIGRSVALAALAAGVFLLATNKGRLFKKGRAALGSLLAKAPAGAPAPAGTPAPATSHGQQPTAANGHVRDVNASTPPPPDSGSNFTPQGDVHGPQ